MLTGGDLVSKVWGAIGLVVVFVAVLYIIFKFFIGAQKNIPGGLAALAGVAVLAALAANPQVVIDIGNTLKDIFVA